MFEKIVWMYECIIEVAAILMLRATKYLPVTVVAGVGMCVKYVGSVVGLCVGDALGAPDG